MTQDLYNRNGIDVAASEEISGDGRPVVEVTFTFDVATIAKLGLGLVGGVIGFLPGHIGAVVGEAVGKFKATDTGAVQPLDVPGLR